MDKQKAVRQSAIQEPAFVNMLNDEMELLILSLGYRKESDTKNLRLSSMQTGVIILGRMLCDKLQTTPKGDKYVVLFSGDCEELIKDALEKVRQEVE